MAGFRKHRRIFGASLSSPKICCHNAKRRTVSESANQKYPSPTLCSRNPAMSRLIAATRGSAHHANRQREIIKRSRGGAVEQLESALVKRPDLLLRAAIGDVMSGARGERLRVCVHHVDAEHA